MAGRHVFAQSFLEMHFLGDLEDTLEQLQVSGSQWIHDQLFDRINHFENLVKLMIESHPVNVNLLELPCLRKLEWTVAMDDDLVVSKAPSWQESWREFLAGEGRKLKGIVIHDEAEEDVMLADFATLIHVNCPYLCQLGYFSGGFNLDRTLFAPLEAKGIEVSTF